MGNAHKFINYMLQPEVIAKCTNFTHYANANLAATKFVDPAILADPAVYPDDKIRKRLWTQRRLSADMEKIYAATWDKIKSGSST